MDIRNQLEIIIVKLVRQKEELEKYSELSDDRGFTEDAVQYIEMAIEKLREANCNEEE